MEFIKKHWQKILIVLFVLLFFGTCTSNCSHKNEIRVLKNTYASTDSIISSLNDSISFYKLEIKELKRDKKEMAEKIEMLNKSVSDLNKALNRSVVVNIKQESDEK